MWHKVWLQARPDNTTKAFGTLPGCSTSQPQRLSFEELETLDLKVQLVNSDFVRKGDFSSLEIA